MILNIFEIYRNHVRYIEINKYSEYFLLSLERRIVTCETNAIGETDLEFLELNNKRIASYKASKRDVVFIMGSAVTYPTQWFLFSLNFKSLKAQNES
ncbi:MAG: hypothetical protein Q8N01_06005 [Sulfuricurvum sp.]|nr:hypothetical protein [Sulfuricurvum sp.]